MFKCKAVPDCVNTIHFTPKRNHHLNSKQLCPLQLLLFSSPGFKASVRAVAASLPGAPACGGPTWLNQTREARSVCGARMRGQHRSAPWCPASSQPVSVTPPTTGTPPKGADTARAGPSAAFPADTNHPSTPRKS